MIDEDSAADGRQNQHQRLIAGCLLRIGVSRRHGDIMGVKALAVQALAAVEENRITVRSPLEALPQKGRIVANGEAAESIELDLRLAGASRRDTPELSAAVLSR